MPGHWAEIEMWQYKAMEDGEFVDTSQIMAYTFQNIQLLSGLTTDVCNMEAVCMLLLLDN